MSDNPESRPDQLPAKGTETPEFPEWARKPSPLDALIQTDSSMASQATDVLEPRRPTPLKTWTNNEVVSAKMDSKSPVAHSDRHSPFSDELGVPRSPGQPGTDSIAQVDWPDQNYNARHQRPNETTIHQPGSFAAHAQQATDPDHSTKPIGASLRSNPVPNPELFIKQPGLRN